MRGHQVLVSSREKIKQGRNAGGRREEADMGWSPTWGLREQLRAPVEQSRFVLHQSLNSPLDLPVNHAPAGAQLCENGPSLGTPSIIPAKPASTVGRHADCSH